MSSEERRKRTIEIVLRANEDAAQQMPDLNEDIRAFGGDPDSTDFDTWDIKDLAMLGEIARQLKAAYGATLTVNAKAQKRKPGPKRASPDELMSIAWEFQNTKKPRQLYIDFNSHRGITRYMVEQAMKYCEAHPDNFRQFQQKKLLELRQSDK
jgi:hypothetical protein